MPNTPTSRHAQLVIWHLTDSALPTGSFAHSAGLETYIQANQVDDAASFSSWLHGYLRQASFNDALAVKFAVELVGASISDGEKLELLAQLDALLHAAQTPKQVRVSMNSMGKRMSRVASIVAPDDFLVQEYARAISARTMHGN
uniref:urease accessory protein UreF n=1 Tax=Corynebacterium stationis TaxID=1705 RepID=UPI00263BC6A7